MITRGTVALAAMLTCLTGCGGSSEPYDPNNEYELEAQCEGFVDGRLKAPATAEYDLTAVTDGSGWTVTGTVDSQNSFGALVRNNVMCAIHFEGDTAHLDDISIG